MKTVLKLTPLALFVLAPTTIGIYTGLDLEVCYVAAGLGSMAWSAIVLLGLAVYTFIYLIKDTNGCLTSETGKKMLTDTLASFRKSDSLRKENKALVIVLNIMALVFIGFFVYADVLLGHTLPAAGKVAILSCYISMVLTVVLGFVRSELKASLTKSQGGENA